MTPQINNSQNNPPKNQSPNNGYKIARWIAGGFFAAFALVNGVHYSSIFLLCAAFLMFPFSFMDSFFQNQNIKTNIAIILSIVLFFVGVITAPPPESANSPSNGTTQTSANDMPDSTKDKNDNSSKPDSSTSNTTSKPNNTTSNDEYIEMVWVPSTGTKYHSKPTCCNMISPRQIPLEDAKNQGYAECKICH